jgi:heat shock protein HspQ
MSDHKFELGDGVKHKLTPFAGVIVSRTDYWLKDGPQFGVQASWLDAGAPSEVRYFEAREIERLQ